jgi:hypothetical protein
MNSNADELFDLKLQLANEFLRNGGTEGIYDVGLLQDLIDFNRHDEITHTSRLKAFINAIFMMNITPPPVLLDNNMNEYKSFVQKDIFFDQIKIDTEEQINELFDRYKDTKDYIFRGQREAAWRLYNTIQRSWIFNKYEGKHDYVSTLKKMAEVCLKNHKEDIKNIIEKSHVDTFNDLALLGFLQHHGCPTPLLDWTSNFYNALFFATDGVIENTAVKEIADYVSIYFLHNENIEPGGAASVIDYALKEESKDIKSKLIAMVAKDEKQRLEMEEHFKDRDFFDRTKIEGSGLVSHMCKIENMVSIPTGIMYYRDNFDYEGIAFSLLNSENIKAQHGAFIWNSSSFKPLEVVAFEAFEKESGSGSYKFCECYNINKKLVPYIHKKLIDLGIKKEIIYPDEEIDTKNIFSESICELEKK